MSHLKSNSVTRRARSQRTGMPGPGPHLPNVQRSSMGSDAGRKASGRKIWDCAATTTRQRLPRRQIRAAPAA
eukprot:9256091-Pyramimonas_sp.AAC.1